MLGTWRFISPVPGFLYLCNMANVYFKIKGIEELQKRLNEMKESVDNRLAMELRQVGEEAVTFSKENKGYHDRTANLKNSISYALFKDGELLEQHIGGDIYNATYTDEHGHTKKNPLSNAEVKQDAKDNLARYAAQDGVVKPQGYTLIVVAGMNYGKYVEDKGYNVLYLTQNYLREELKKVIADIIAELTGKK